MKHDLIKQNSNSKKEIIRLLESVYGRCDDAKCKDRIRFIIDQLENEKNGSSEEVVRIDEEINTNMNSLNRTIPYGNYPLALVLLSSISAKVVERNSNIYRLFNVEKQKKNLKTILIDLFASKKIKTERNADSLKTKLNELTVQIDGLSNSLRLLEEYGEEINEIYKNNKWDEAIKNRLQIIKDDYNTTVEKIHNAIEANKKLRDKIKYIDLVKSVEDLSSYVNSEKEQEELRTKYGIMKDNVCGKQESKNESTSINIQEVVANSNGETIKMPWKHGSNSGTNGNLEYEIKESLEFVKTNVVELKEIKMKLDKVGSKGMRLLEQRHNNLYDDETLDAEIECNKSEYYALKQSQKIIKQNNATLLDSIYVKRAMLSVEKQNELDNYINNVSQIAIDYIDKIEEGNERKEMVGDAVETINAQKINQGAASSALENSNKDDGKYNDYENCLRGSGY